MGYYDGMSMDSDTASSYDVSWTLGLPVILVLPCRGASLSLAAVIKGMVEYRPDSRIRGILLNRVSGMLYPRLKSMLERELKEMGHEIPVVGYVPEDEAFTFESRHLGLVTTPGDGRSEGTDVPGGRDPFTDCGSGSCLQDRGRSHCFRSDSRGGSGRKSEGRSRVFSLAGRSASAWQGTGRFVFTIKRTWSCLKKWDAG